MSAFSYPRESYIDERAVNRTPADYGDDPMKAMVRHYDARCMRKGERSIFSFKPPTVTVPATW